jgi:hypothetical protein
MWGCITFVRNPGKKRPEKEHESCWFSFVKGGSHFHTFGDTLYLLREKETQSTPMLVWRF